MAKSEESPRSTRRRVRRFVFGSLTVVGVVGFWPLKAYEISPDRFVESLGLGRRGYQGTHFYEYPADSQGEEGYSLSIQEFWTPRICRHYFEAQVEYYNSEESKSKTQGGTAIPSPDLGPNGAGWIRPGTFKPELDDVEFIWHHANLDVWMVINYEMPGESREQTARNAIRIIRDGIEREVPGVSTFYNPLAKQLWHDRVRPFLSKRLPKLLPLHGPYLHNRLN